MKQTSGFLRHTALWTVALLPLYGVCQSPHAEHFDNLDAWKPLTFPKIDTHSTYTPVTEGRNSVLKAASAASASGIMQTSTFDVAEFPVLSWRWKVDNVMSKGNARTKDGDDYPIRIYVTFAYDPDTADFGFKRKAQYGLAKKLYGEYPPHSALSYIWANRQHRERIIPNAYSDRAIMIVMQSTDDRAGTWIRERVNIVEDYKKAYGSAPPARATLAIMADSDNTGQSSTAYVDDIRLEPSQK